MGSCEMGVTSAVQLQWRMTYFEKASYVTNVDPCTSNFFIFMPSLQFYSVKQIKVQICNGFHFFFKFLTCAFFHSHGLKGNKIQSHFCQKNSREKRMRSPCPLQSHTGEEKAPSCSQKTRILLTLRNIGVHQVLLKMMGNVLMYLCICVYRGKSSRAENHIPMFVCCIALAWFLVSQGTFRSL